MTTTRGAGHFGPLAPFAHALRRAGDEVLVAAPDFVRPMVEGAGLPFWPFDAAPEGSRDAIFSSLEGLSEEEKGVQVVGEVFTRLDARAAYPRVLAACAAWRPDLVVRETCEFAGYLVAERRGIPHARAAITLGSSEDMLVDIAAPVLDDLREELGLPADPEGEGVRRSPFFTLTPIGMEDPAESGPPHARRFREVEDEGPGLPAAWWPDEERPLVYLTFGSVLPQMELFPDVYRAAITELARLPVRVLVTIGRDRDPAELGPLPPGVHVEPWVPQRHVMPHAAAMVCHGGFGTTRMGLSAGMPMAVMPFFADQPYNARRIAELGAGIALEATAEAAGLSTAVEALLHDPSYRAAAGRIADEVRALPSVNAAPAAMRELATRA